jgi:hypothetical protein
MAVAIMSRTIRGRLYFVAGPIAFLSFADAVAALAALQANLSGGDA